MRADSIDVYTGNANPELASKIARYLGRELGKAEVFAFANENIFVKILDNAREKDVFIVQPTSRPVSTSIMELLIMIDAFKRASAGRITAVIPYYGYGRSDKKDQPRVPITARLVADMLQLLAQTESSRWIFTKDNSKVSSTCLSMNSPRCTCSPTTSGRRGPKT